MCDYIRRSGSRDAFLARFGQAASEGFDPDRDLSHIGLANQTTMLMSESLEIGEMFRQAMRDRYGDAELGTRATAPSTRSAARRRSARTRSSRCSTSNRST